MTNWRYVFADLLTDRTIDELSVDGVTFDDRINDPGSFSGTIPIPNAGVGERARAIVEGRTVVYVYRGANIWGGPYILWQVRPSSDARGRITLSLQGAGLESYFARREIRADLSYAGVEQLDIARDLVAQLQSAPNGNLGIIPDDAESGILRDRNYLASDQGTFGARLDELAAVENGFEFRVIAYIDPATGNRVRKLVTGYPTLGSPLIEHRFSQPGTVISWEFGGDATAGATSFRATGESVGLDAGVGDFALTSDVVDRVDLLADGWPRIDRTDAYSSVIEKGTLDAHAAENADRYGGSLRILSATIALPDDDFTYSPARLGDTARIVLSNAWFAPIRDEQGRLNTTFSQAWRVVGMSVTPNGRGAGKDTATLIFQTGA